MGCMFERLPQSLVCGSGPVIPIKQQRGTFCMLRVRADPGIFVGESPGLDRRASRMREASDGYISVNFRLALQVFGPGLSICIHR